MVIQSMIVQELMAGHASELRQIKHIVLFGTPIEGTELPGIIKALTPKAYDLAIQRADVVRLNAEWINRVYRSTGNSKSDTALRIPVTAVVGLEDSFIDRYSAQAYFQDPEPETVPGTHITMKLPADTDALSYQIVKRALLRVPRWKEQPIRVANIRGVPEPRSSWWTDIVWLTPQEGWLSGVIHQGGGGGWIGRGILLKTESGGETWREQKSFASGQGDFNWGGIQYNWSEVGPIYQLQFYRHLRSDGNFDDEGWAATATGIYRTRDGGSQWERVTPPLSHPDGYALYGGLANIQQFSEVYAVGWQGIAHWSRSTNQWRVDKKTHGYPISAISISGGIKGEEVWAAGRAGVDSKKRTGSYSHGALYHLTSDGKWSQAPLEGIEFDDGQTFNSVMVKDRKTVFAAGDNGLMVRGQRTEDGAWRWKRLETGTKSVLRSIAANEDRLWAVGGDGTILLSYTNGDSWIRWPPILDAKKAPVDLICVRDFGREDVWVLGNLIVVKSQGP